MQKVKQAPTGDNMWWRWVATILMVVVATETRALLDPLLEDNVPFASYFPVIIAATWFFGVWPGALSLVLSALAGWFFFIPLRYSFFIEKPEFYGVAFFCLMGITLLWLAAHSRRAVWREEMAREYFNLAVEFSPLGKIVVSDAGAILLVNKELEKQFGYNRSELLNQSVDVLVPDSIRGHHAKLRESYTKHPSPRQMGLGRDLKGKRKDETEFPIEVGLAHHEGMTLVTVIDITERKAMEERQTLLQRELFHRTRNQMMLVQSVAQRSFRGLRPSPEEKQLFIERIHALSRADTLLLESHGEGADMATIMHDTLDPLSDRVIINCNSLRVNFSTTQNLSLIIHELATNSLKYGALSVEGGYVDASVTLSDDKRVCLKWEEYGGPEIIQPPENKGFGMTLFEHVARIIGGKSSIEFEGRFRYCLEIPLQLAGHPKYLKKIGIITPEGKSIPSVDDLQVIANKNAKDGRMQRHVS
jgi:PAS domain S-box-containing protein